MNIEFQKSETELIATPEGRLDSNSAPGLEAKLLENLEGMSSLILDFAQVDYISSAGLRVVLAMEQLMAGRGGSLKVIHTNEYVLDVFDTTGFLDIIHVEN